MSERRRRGSHIGPYRLEAPLGRGAMGEVWRAHGPDGPVALKLLLLHDEGAAARFRREARLGAALDHPNLVRVTDVGEHDGHTYLAMELVDGTTLGDLLWRGGTLGPKLLVDLGRQLAAGVDALHEADLVHRDLKPGNVMVTRRGVVKVADLGLVGGADMETLTRTGSVVGTPRFMAPEQIQEARSDARSDIFAVALILYLALTGKDPYERTSETPLGEVLQRLVSQEPRPWHASRVDGPLDRVFQAALSRDPARRPETAGAFVAALATAIEKERSGSPGAPDDPSTELLTVDPTNTLELAATAAPQLPKEIDELPPPAAPARGRSPGTPPAPGSPSPAQKPEPRGPWPWLALGLLGALVGALILPHNKAVQVTAWGVYQGNSGSALVFHTDVPVALAGSSSEPATAHVVAWNPGAPGPETSAGTLLFPDLPGATPEPIGSGRLRYDEAGSILLRFRAPTLGSLRIESGVHRWRPSQSEGQGPRELDFRLPGGEITEPLSVLLEAGEQAVELARLVPPPPARAVREAALERLAAWDPREALAAAVLGDHAAVARELLEHPALQAYLEIEANLVHTLERHPASSLAGLDRVALVNAYLHYAGIESPFRLTRSPIRHRVWRHGFWPLPIPRYDGLVVYHHEGRIFSYDHAGEASSTHDPTGLMGGHFGTRALRAPELPPGPCWLELYSNLWREMTFAAIWVNDVGPFFLAEQPRAAPLEDLEAYRAKAPGPFEKAHPDHRILRVQLPGGVVRPEDPLAASGAAANQLRIELRSWASPKDIMNPWAFLHAYGVRPIDAVPLPREPIEPQDG